MKNLKVAEEFVVGKHSIGWINSQFLERVGNVEFEKAGEVPKFQKLPHSMTDEEIESELKPGICALGDVLSFLENPPEESKDGWANLFYFPSCVVSVGWCSESRYWDVYAWRRGGLRWGGGERVFSPATGLQTLSSVPSETLPLELEINGVKYRKI